MRRVLTRKTLSEFTDYLTELFEQFGPVYVRRMFGGHGVYHDGMIFGLVVDDTLYLKTDPATAHRFESRGLGPFEFNKAGKTIKTSYYLAPAEILDDPEQAALWARQSFEIAYRVNNRTGKQAGRRKRKKKT